MVFLKTDRGEVNKLQVPSILYVGRGNSSDIRPDSKSVSKSHGQLTVLFNTKTGKPEAWIEDFNSTYGTFVGETPDNLEKITEKTRLFFGFYIRFGHAPYCYQYLELDPNDDDTTCAKTTDFMESGATTLSKVSSAKYSQKTIKKQLTEDEEFAMLLQQQLNESDSPPKPRIQTLVNQFEMGAQWSPESSAKSAPRVEIPELSAVKDIVQRFESSSASPRTPSPQASTKFDFAKKKQLAKLQTESFSESAWEQSQSVAATPTVCLPPSKNDGSFKGTMYHFLDDKYIEEKAGADEDMSRTSTARSTVEPAAPVRDFDAEWSTKQLPLPPRPTSPSHTAACTDGTVAASRQSTPQSTPPGIPVAQDKTISGHFLPPVLEKSPSKTLAGPTPMSDTECATVEALHKKKVAIIRARQLFREKKLSTLSSVVQKYPTFGSVAKQWWKAVGEVDFIPGGFCISLVLPYMEKVKVKPVGRKLNKIRVDAQRWVTPDDTCASYKDVEYVGEFKLQGLRSEVRYEDLTYDYCEDTGLLCVYVNRFYLKDPRVFVPQHHFPPYLSAPVYVPVETAQEAEAVQNKPKARWSTLITTLLGVNRKKKERTLERNAEIYRRTLNSNPKSPGRKQSRALSMDAAAARSPSPLELHEWSQESTAPMSVDDRPMPSIRKSPSGSGREMHSQKSMDGLKELIDKGDVDANVEYI